jgi:threonine dehydrogenase-like Zn-dependent dehydrogenase
MRKNNKINIMIGMSNKIYIGGKSMKSAIYYGIRDVRIEDRPNPVCSPKDIIVKSVKCGICGSDVTGYLVGGQYVGMDIGAGFGHEMAGKVTEVGSEVKGIKVGDRVFANPIRSCPPGMSDMFGGFSEYVRVPNAEVNYNVYILPDNMTYDEGALIEPVAVGTRGKNVPKAKIGDHVVVYGAGTIGLSCTMSLIAQGITPVVIVRNNKKKSFLEKIGSMICNVSEVDMYEFLKEKFGMTTSRVGYPIVDIDIVVECAGAPNVLPEFLKMAKQGSRLSIVGVSKQEPSINLNRILSSEAIIQGSCAYDHEDIVEVINNLASRNTHLQDLITHHYKLDQINEAILMAADRDKSIKVVIDME